MDQPQSDPAPSASFIATTKALGLLDISYDIRMVILDMLLLNRDRSKPWNNRIIHDDVRPILVSFRRGKIDDGNLQIEAVQVLCVCRQLYLEGRQALYGRNHFVAYQFPTLKYRLPKILGRRNMAEIRKITLGVPMAHKKEEPKEKMGGFLEFLSTKLPNLTEFTLTCLFRTNNIKDDNGHSHLFYQAPKEYRAILHTAAWITSRHPSLKLAIWEAGSGVVEWYGDDIKEEAARQQRGLDLDAGPESEPEFSEPGMPGIGPEPSEDLMEEIYMDCRLNVRLLGLNQRYRIRTIAGNRPHPRLKLASVAKDIILDCQTIRRSRYFELGYGSPLRYALPDDSESSEPKRIVKYTQDGTMYASWEDTQSYLLDRFTYLSMKDMIAFGREDEIPEAARAAYGRGHNSEDTSPAETSPEENSPEENDSGTGGW